MQVDGHRKSEGRRGQDRLNGLTTDEIHTEEQLKASVAKLPRIGETRLLAHESVFRENLLQSVLICIFCKSNFQQDRSLLGR